MKRGFSLSLLIALFGCAQNGSSDTLAEAASGNGVASDRRARLAQIVSECGLPSQSLTVNDHDEVLFAPPPDAPYESVDCVLRKLTPGDIRNMGFVGNERVTTNDAQAH